MIEVTDEFVDHLLSGTLLNGMTLPSPAKLLRREKRKLQRERLAAQDEILSTSSTLAEFQERMMKFDQTSVM